MASGILRKGLALSIFPLLLLFVLLGNMSLLLREADLDNKTACKYAEMLARALQKNTILEADIERQAELKEKIEERRRMNILLICMAGADLLLAIICSSFFVLSLTRRLTMLNDNVQTFSLGREIPGPRLGADELGRLDAVFHEMTAVLKESQNKLLASEARLNLLIETMPLGLLILTEGFEIKIDSANKTFKDQFGFSDADLIGRKIDSIIPGCSEAFLVFEEQLKMQAGELAKTENLLLSTGGVNLPVELSFSKLEMPEANRRVLAVQDISKRKELEKAKQEFLAMVTHDLKTPLSSISLFHQLLRNSAYGELPEAATEALQSAERSTEMLLSLVNGLLEIEKIEAGKLSLNCSDTSVFETVEQAVLAVSNYAAEKGIRISKSDLSKSDLNDEQDSHMSADKNRIIQVLINLIGNAIKFSEPGSEVLVRTGHYPDKNEVLFEIIDCGCGIEIDKQLLIFERFKQLDNKTAEQGRGSGLGLAISRGIVEAHHGKIGVVSSPGKGSRFWFSIPQAQSVEALTEKQEA